INGLTGCSTTQLTQSKSSIADFQQQSTQSTSLTPQKMNISEENELS
ncbi:unnamed protein product, partial [Rotaria magnacalcarata]